MNSLGIRVISAVVGVSTLVLLYWFWRQEGLIAVSIFVSLAALKEFSRMIYDPPQNILRWYFCLYVALVYISFIWFERYFIIVFALSSSFIFATLMFTIRQDGDLTRVFHLQAKSILGFVYCGVFPAFVVKVLSGEFGSQWFAVLLVSVFGADICAYFAGIYFGKNKLFPLVSPKKTRVGAVGGLVGAVFFGTTAATILQLPYSPVSIAAMTFCLGLFGELGDLFESMIKRAVGVKDSGTIMPGHGGLLDRVDGIYFAAPVAYLFSLIFSS